MNETYIYGTSRKQRNWRTPTRVLPEDNGAAELVACDRFDARLTKAACLARFEQSARKPGKAGPEAMPKTCKGCSGCPQGEERSG